jgi:hypothetical protein
MSHRDEKIRGPAGKRIRAAVSGSLTPGPENPLRDYELNNRNSATCELPSAQLLGSAGIASRIATER